MGKTLSSSIFAAIFSGAVLLIAGCDRQDGGQSAVDTVQPAVSTNSEETASEEVLSEDMKKAVKMRDALDDDNILEALKLARDLMGSKETAVRSEVVDVLSWIGRRALPELAEMAGDSDNGIRETAMTGLEQGLSEISGDNSKALAIEQVLPLLKRADQQEAVLMALNEIDEFVALRLLVKVISANKGTALEECARQSYTHVSGGEIFESAEVTEQFIKREKESNQ